MLLGSSREEAAGRRRPYESWGAGFRLAYGRSRFIDLFAFFRLVPTARAVVVATDELHMWYSQLPNAVNEHQAKRIQVSGHHF